MGNISYEGVHADFGNQRTILGKNGLFLVLSPEGKAITVYPLDKGSFKYYEESTNYTYFDKVEHSFSLIQIVKKWLGL